MLLNNRLNQIQSQIDAFLAEIATLQTKVTTLQTHAQEVQTVEQAAESALSQISTALSMLSAVCPDEVATFKAAVDAKFREPLPYLGAAVNDVETPVEPPCEPNPEDDTTTVDAEAIAVEEDKTTADPQAIAESDNTLKTPEDETAADTDNATNGNGNGHHLVSYADLKKLDKQTLTKLAKQHGVEGGKTKDSLAQALDGIVSESEMEAATGSNGRG